jgi:hypothetical protein
MIEAVSTWLGLRSLAGCPGTHSERFRKMLPQFPLEDFSDGASR